MADYILSVEAQDSLKEIRLYSINKFGKAKTNNYLKSVRDKMQVLAQNPALGVVRDDLKVGFYSSFVASHTIYYRKGKVDIEIIDVLHQSMDPSKNLIDKQQSG